MMLQDMHANPAATQPLQIIRLLTFGDGEEGVTDRHYCLKAKHTAMVIDKAERKGY